MHRFNAHKLVVQGQSAPPRRSTPDVAHPEPEDGFERVFEYFVNDAGVVMVECGGEVIAPVVSVDWEQEVEDEVEEEEEEWETVSDEEEEEEEEWVKV